MGAAAQNRAACSAAASAQAASASWAFAWWAPADAGSHQILAAAFDPGPRPHGATAPRAGAAAAGAAAPRTAGGPCHADGLARLVPLLALHPLPLGLGRTLLLLTLLLLPLLAAEGFFATHGPSGTLVGQGCHLRWHHGRRRANCRLSRLLDGVLQGRLRRLRHGLWEPCGAPVCALRQRYGQATVGATVLGAVVTSRRLALAAPAGLRPTVARCRVRHTGATGRGAAWR